MRGQEGIWCLCLPAVSGLTRVRGISGAETPCAGMGARIPCEAGLRVQGLDLRRGRDNWSLHALGSGALMFNQTR